MKKSFAYPYGVWLAVFILAPILMVVVYAFHNADGGFTLHNFSYLPGYLPIFGRSFWLAFLSTVVCLALGYPMAYLMSRLSASKQSLCMMLIMLPMWINFLLRIIAIRMLLSDNGILNYILSALNLPNFSIMYTPAAIVIGMVYDYFPFMVLPIYNALIKIDRNLLDAAGDLGATPARTFRKIIFPLSVPGVISGITMVFVPSISEFVIADILGGGKVLLIGNIIEQEFNQGNNWHLGSGISIVLMIFIFVSMMIGEMKGSGEEASLW